MVLSPNTAMLFRLVIGVVVGIVTLRRTSLPYHYRRVVSVIVMQRHPRIGVLPPRVCDLLTIDLIITFYVWPPQHIPPLIAWYYTQMVGDAKPLRLSLRARISMG